MYELTKEETELNLKRLAKIGDILATMSKDDPRLFGVQHLSCLGGSDICKLLGCKYGTPYDLWLEKTMRTPLKKTSLQMRVGTFCEELVAQLYSEQTHNRVLKASSLVDEARPYLAANFDRLAVDDSGNIVGGLECKTAGSNAPVYDPRTGETRPKWGEPNTYGENGELLTCSEECDPLYYGQVQFYLAMSNLPWWDIAVLISNNTFRVYRITPNQDFIAHMLQTAHEFWTKNVLRDEPPARVLADYLEPPRADDVSAEATPEQIETCRRIQQLDWQMAGLELQKQALKDKLAPAFESVTKLTYHDAGGKLQTLCSFKSSQRTTFNTAKFKAEHSDLYDKYCEKSETKRSFRLGTNF